MDHTAPPYYFSNDNPGAAARNLIAFCRHGVLSTISVSEAGAPFGSIVPYCLNEQGDIVIYISLIAEHYRNLSADPRSSLTVFDPFGFDDPQAYARATVMTEFAPVPDSERKRYEEIYEQRFPRSINYEIAHNFLFMRAQVGRIRWIGGFGDIRWVRGDDYRRAEEDPLAASALDIIAHMNEDHHDALELLVRAHSGYDPNRFRVQMVHLSSKSLTIELRSGSARQLVTVAFCAPVTEENIRETVVALVQAARKSAGA